MGKDFFPIYIAALFLCPQIGRFVKFLLTLTYKKGHLAIIQVAFNLWSKQFLYLSLKRSNQFFNQLIAA